MRHWNYLKYLLKHKFYVLQAGYRLGGIPPWRLLFHDLSKFSLTEWFGYADKFFGPEELKHHPCTIDGFNLAWLHHIHHNPHHWEHWLLYDKPLEMPEPYVREMVADWAGAGRGITGKWGVREWYLANCNRIRLAPMSRYLAEKFMKELFLEEWSNDN